MTSESNTERLIDLMFDEVSDQEKDNFLEEIAESSALQQERDDIRALLGDVSEIWRDEPVSLSLHASIMDAATAAANERSEKKQFVAPPVKPVGLWGRLRSSNQLGQLAMVATVVIAGAFVFRFVNLDDKAMVHEEVAVSIPEKGETKNTGQVPPTPTEGFAEDNFGEEKEKNKIAAPNEKEAELKIADTKIGNSASDKVAEKFSKFDRKAEKKAAQKPRQKAIAKRGAPKKTSTKRAASKPKSAPLISSGTAQNKAYFDGLADDTSAKGSASTYKERAESAEELTLVPAKTIDSVSSKYSARDYSGTIQAADEFVGLKSGTSAERARALQLKAQSLANLGRYQEALRVYDSILKNYKNYQSTAISSARAEISRKLEERQPKQKKRKSKKKSTYDFDEASTNKK